MRDSAKSVAASRSSGYWRTTSRIAPAYAVSSAVRSSGGSGEYRVARAPISARSFALACVSRSLSFCPGPSPHRGRRCPRRCSSGWLIGSLQPETSEPRALAGAPGARAVSETDSLAGVSSLPHASMATEAASPMTMPIPASTNACLTNIHRISPCCAPSAMRIPISRRRCDTV